MVKFAIMVFDEENRQVYDSGLGDAVNPCCMLPAFKKIFFIYEISPYTREIYLLWQSLQY